jgi:hypothetical protein
VRRTLPRSQIDLFTCNLRVRWYGIPVFLPMLATSCPFESGQVLRLLPPSFQNTTEDRLGYDATLSRTIHDLPGSFISEYDTEVSKKFRKCGVMEQSHQRENLPTLLFRHCPHEGHPRLSNMQRACSRIRTISAVTPQSLVSCKIAEKCGRNIWSLVMQDRAAHARLAAL